MPAEQDDDRSHKGKGSRKDFAKKDGPAVSGGGSYGDRQPQYGTGAPDWQEPLPGRDERGDFGAGGEAFGSASGQGRYGDEDQARSVEKPGHPAWQPFVQPQANQLAETTAGSSRDASLDPQYRDWGNRTMRRHDEEYRAFRAERQKTRDAEFEEWRKARSGQGATKSTSRS
jgi:hypothetical protein